MPDDAVYNDRLSADYEQRTLSVVGNLPSWERMCIYAVHDTLHAQVKSHDPVKMILYSHFSFVECRFSITFSYLTKI